MNPTVTMIDLAIVPLILGQTQTSTGMMRKGRAIRMLKKIATILDRCQEAEEEAMVISANPILRTLSSIMEEEEPLETELSYF